MARTFEVQGHRGARGLQPENTLPSFEAALDCGVTSIETDLHLTRDGVPVIFHDAVISHRLCRMVDARYGPAPTLLPRLAELEYAQLRSYAADVNPSPSRFPEQCSEPTPLAQAFAEEQGIHPYALPALGHLFAFAAAYAGSMGARFAKSEAQREAARRVCFDLELKRVPFRPENIGDAYDGTKAALLEERVLAAIDTAGVRTRTRIRSFDHRCVRRFLDRAPDIEGVVLIAGTAPVQPVELAQTAGVRIYCPEFEFLDRDTVETLHRAEVRVLPWTVNEEADWARLLDWGVDGMTTDFPDRLSAFVQNR